MELLYLWVKDYKNIKRQGFNISSKFNFEYNEEKNEITISKNEKHIENFFGENILDVTALVGENGSGKSTFCQVIFGIQEVPLFYILGNISEVKPNFKCSYYGIDHPTLKPDFDCITEEPYSMDKLEVVNLGPSNCFYSPILSSDYLSSGRGSAPTDISTNSMFYAAGLDISKLLNEETYRQINFLVENSSFESGFRLPKSLRFWGKHENSAEIEHFKTQIVESVDENMIIFLEKSRQFETSTEINIYYAFFMLFLNELRYTKNEKLIFNSYRPVEKFTAKDFNKIIKSEDYSFKKSILVFFEIYGSYLETEEKEIFNGYFSAAKSFFEIVPEYCNQFHGEDKWFNNYTNSYNYVGKYIEYPADSKADLIKLENEFLKRYRRLNINFIDFEWTGLSSGEMANLSMYSRFHDLNTVKGVTDEFLLIIDEGELYLHPKWQKEFINNLISGLNVIFKGKKIQLIFTSHSPYIVSDLPKDNIVFLKRGTEKDKPITKDISAEGNCIVVKGDELKNMDRTFGANIHTLLTDSFFMEGGLIGEFAKKKIEEIITFWERVKNKDANHAELIKEYVKKQYRKVQQLIGEEYLRNIVGNHIDEAEAILGIKNPELEIEIEKLVEKFGKKEVQKILKKK